MDRVQIGIEDGDLEDLTVSAFYEQGVTALEVVFDLAEGSLFPGGIEDEVTLAGGRCNNAVQFRRLVAFGNLDSSDDMIAGGNGGIVRVDDASFGIDHHQCAVDAN